jgi:hypothetical protein
MIAAVMMTEAIVYSKTQGKELYIAFLDTKKAFDVVWHNSLLRKLYTLGIDGNLWLIAREMYTEMKSQVKWDGLLSREIPIRQGLNQGGVASPNFWKTYENPLFKLLEEMGIGYKIGSIYMGQIILADDKAFLSNSPNQLQVSINTASNYANSERYINGIEKSEVMIMNRRPGSQQHEWSLNGQTMNIAKDYTHIGINRNDEKASLAEATIQKGRRMAYAMMGAGLHGVNGINPCLSYKLWNTYVLSSCTFGLEALLINPKEIKLLLSYERKTFKQFQTFPNNVANEALYILIGALPIDRYIDKKKLTLFGAKARREESPEQLLASRQLAMLPLKSNSWYQGIERLTQKYNLPSAHSVIANPFSKPRWKMLVDQAVDKATTQDLISNCETKSSLRYLNYHSYEIGRPHPVWKSVEPNVRDVERATVKAQLLCGVYRLQAFRAKINQHEISTCPLCKLEPEDRTHFIINCKVLEDTRKTHLEHLKQIFKTQGKLMAWYHISGCKETTTQLILDAEKLRWLVGDHIPSLIEPTTRKLCFDIHKKRSLLIAPGGPAHFQRIRKKKPKPILRRQ